MSDPLRIALVSPHGWPAVDDVAWHVAEEAAALARRGHGVTMLAPTPERARVAAGRARLRAAESGDASALLAEPGELREVAVGRALPAGPRRRLGGPIDLASALEVALSAAPFDVVHLHEPLAPSPALAALRHARGVAAVTFHRAEPLAGVAVLRPLVDRALARADLRVATTRADARTLAQILPGDYRVIAPGVDLERFAPAPAPAAAPPGLVVIARGRDRTGLRFLLGTLRGVDLDALGPVTVLGPPDAPWRTRAAVPKALRERVAVIPDGGPPTRAAALARGAIAALATPEDVAGPALREAMTCGRAILAPRAPAIEEAVRHGVEALILPPFDRATWSATLAELAGDPGRRAALGAAAAAAGRARGWDDVALELEAAYAGALAADGRADAPAPARVAADLRVRPGPRLSPAQVVAACRERGLGAVAVASPEGLGPALEVARLAPADLAVIPGQEIATADGALIGLFLTHEVPAGLDPVDAAEAVRDQGGIVVAPHPDGEPAPPSPAALRRLAGLVDCWEVATAAADGPADEAAARLARRLGLLGCAASGAARPDDVGAAVTELRPFHGPADLLDALAGASLARRPPRRRRSRAARPRGRGARRTES